jgi:hypothetical protein
MEQTIATGMRGLQALCSLPLGAQLLAGQLEEAQAALAQVKG